MSIVTDELRRILFAQVTDAVAILDARAAGFPLIDANRAWCERFGDGRPLVGEPWAALVRGAGEQGLLAIVARVAASGEPFQARDFPYRAAPGADGLRSWNWQCLPLAGDLGLVERLVVIVADVTERRRAQARRERDALAAAARRRAGELEAVIDALADGVFLLDRAGRIVEANDAGLRLLGLTPPVRARRLLEALVDRELAWDDGRPLHTGDALLNAAFGGQRAASELILAGTDPHGPGRRFLCLCATPIVGTGRRVGGAVVLLRDITPQKRAEAEQDAFLSLIAHEVKSPLTAIKGFAQLACRAADGLAGEGGERVARHLRVIDQQAARIGRLVDELSDANRLRKGTLALAPVRCDLAAIVAAAVQGQRTLPEVPAIDLAVEASPLPIEADPALIEQVLANLLGNAARYSPAAERIAVTVGRVGRSAHVAVRDRGIGIPPDELGRIFERFYRAANAGEGGGGGLGLGLFIAREIVARSGGSLWAESGLGVGSTFHVALPLVDGGGR